MLLWIGEEDEEHREIKCTMEGAEGVDRKVKGTVTGVEVEDHK